MMRIPLIAHSTTPMSPDHSLCVALSLTGDAGLLAEFECGCDPGALRLPQARTTEFADELWRHTCCELFLGIAGESAYREFNCSPSGQWAAYAFSDYRLRDASQSEGALRAPHIGFAARTQGWTLAARLDAAALPAGQPGRIELGLAVVLEAADGGLSYWALRHAATRPDFHRRESFALRLSDLS